jgi:hypothetical protein
MWHTPGTTDNWYSMADAIEEEEALLLIKSAITRVETLREFMLDVGGYEASGEIDKLISFCLRVILTTQEYRVAAATIRSTLPDTDLACRAYAWTGCKEHLALFIVAVLATGSNENRVLSVYDSTDRASRTTPAMRMHVEKWTNHPEMREEDVFLCTAGGVTVKARPSQSGTIRFRPRDAVGVKGDTPDLMCVANVDLAEDDNLWCREGAYNFTKVILTAADPASAAWSGICAVAAEQQKPFVMDPVKLAAFREEVYGASFDTDPTAAMDAEPHDTAADSEPAMDTEPHDTAANSEATTAMDAEETQGATADLDPIRVMALARVAAFRKEVDCELEAMDAKCASTQKTTE